MHPDDRQTLKAALTRAAEQDVPYEPEYRAVWPDGSIHHLTARGELVRDDKGRPVRMNGIIWDITVRKQAEGALARDGRRNTLLLQNGSDGIHILDSEGNALDVNIAFCKVLGYKREELIGANVVLWDAHLSPDELKQKLQEQLDTRDILTFETRHRRKDGSLCDVEVTGQALELNGERVLFFSSRDITERNHAKKVLKESEFFLRESQRIASIGSYKLDVMSGLWKSSEELDRIFGIGKDFSRNVQGWQDLAHPQDAEMMGQYLSEEVLGKRKPFNKEYRIVRKSDGETRWVSGMGELAYGPDGKVVSLIGTIQDITERKRSEESLRKSSERFERMAETVPTVLYDYVLNPDGSNRFTYMNHRSKEIFGVDAEEIIADSNKFWSLVHEDDRQLVRDEDNRANKTGIGLVIEHRIVTPQGELKWLHTESKPSSTATGEPSTWSGFILDITERKAAQEGIEHLAQHDILTGLANRALFSDRLQNALSSALRDRCSLALMSIDLDMFKPVNDQFGHPVGDLLLKEVAQRMVACVRDSDTVARIGGDEFVVLLRNVAGENEALTVAEKIRASLEQPFVVAGHSVRISCCVGIALYPQHGEDELSLSKHADFSMYHAKGNGRNQVRLHQAH
ncbi:MAG: PAS domain S-box protein [Rhodoferax sp.]|nr:PAS domain S-box protein [Rhodoferax sp.]